MQTAGEERVAVLAALKRLDDSAADLRRRVAEVPQAPLSLSLATEAAEALDNVTALTARQDAERLLAVGVGMWNSVIALEGGGGERRDSRENGEEGQTVQHGEEDAFDGAEALAKTRHVGVDCIFMATTVLGGISARYNIDEVSLLKFYTVTGKRYAMDVGDMEMASICFARAHEFAASARSVAEASEDGVRALSKALFDLLLGSAECAWDSEDPERAESLVSEAVELLPDVPAECEYMASILYNFGFFCHQAKEPENALEWLKKSKHVRGLHENPHIDVAKQARTSRLSGVCLIALKRFDEALHVMEAAEEACHDAAGAYLLLKLAVIMRSEDVFKRLMLTLEDPDSSLDVCMASIALLTDAQRLKEAVKGFDVLLKRFEGDAKVLVCGIAPRYFECLSSLGCIDDALALLDNVCGSLRKLQDESDIMAAGSNGNEGELPGPAVSFSAEVEKWSALMLSTAGSLAERKEHMAAAFMLNRCLVLAGSANETVTSDTDSESSGNIAMKNEASICRLAASCGFLAVSELSSRPWNKNHNGAEEKKSSKSCPGELLDQAMKHAQRAKALDKDDFPARLLCFKIYLFRKEPEMAALEMHEASREIHKFDAGSLAEAACQAKDAGSESSVLAVLLCILRVSAIPEKGKESPQPLKKNSKSDIQPMRGFVGAVLVSAVNILMDRSKKKSSYAEKQTDVDDSSGSSPAVESSPGIEMSESETTELLEVLKAGLSVVSLLGKKEAFDDKLPAETALDYLVDVSWNAGRHAGSVNWNSLWGDLFDVCCGFLELKNHSKAVLQARRKAKIMAASAIIENQSQFESDKDAATDNEKSAGGEQSCHEAVSKRAVNLLLEVRALTSELQKDADDDGHEDHIFSLLSVLEARCYASRGDHASVAKIIEESIGKDPNQPLILEQLASVAFAMKTPPNSSGSVTIRLDNVVKALSAALNSRLLSPNPDVKACSVTLREILSVELSRITGSNRAYAMLQKALGLLKEHKGDYPVEEQRWLTATAWDTAQMHMKIGQVSEARRWTEAAITFTEGNAGLRTYVPRMKSLLASLK